MSRLRVVALLAVLAAACSSGSAEPGTIASTTSIAVTTSIPTPSSTTATSTAQTTTTTTTAAKDPSIPFPDNRGDDWTRIVTELSAFGGWLFENPNAELIEQMAVPDSPFYKSFEPIISEYEEKGWRDLPGGRSEVILVDLEGLSDDGRSARVTLVSDYAGATTVDTAGEIVKVDEGRQRSAFEILLEFSEEWGWRYTSAEWRAYVGGIP